MSTCLALGGMLLHASSKWRAEPPSAPIHKGWAGQPSSPAHPKGIPLTCGDTSKEPQDAREHRRCFVPAVAIRVNPTWRRCIQQWGAAGFEQRVYDQIAVGFEGRADRQNVIESLTHVLWNDKVIQPMLRLVDEHAIDTGPQVQSQIRATSSGRVLGDRGLTGERRPADRRLGSLSQRRVGEPQYVRVLAMWVRLVGDLFEQDADQLEAVDGGLRKGVNQILERMMG